MTSADPTIAAPAGRARDIARARFRASAEVPTAFFEANAARVAVACRDLARSFHGGHRLLVLGAGAQRSDALHISVEFVHPVIVGKRSLPALALSEPFAAQIQGLGEPGDIVLALAAEASAEPLQAALAAARDAGLGTIALVAGEAGNWVADYVFAVPSEDPFVIQETHETLYHVLWELAHVFLEHPATLR